MEDTAIIDLYWARSQQAVAASEEKYGPYCHTIARRILDREEDAEECVNDTWLHAWNAMPPQRPGVLSAFFGKLTRNLSLDRWRRLKAAKRGGIGSDIVAELNERAFDLLDAPPLRVGALNIPIPYNAALEAAVLPDVQDVLDAVHKSLSNA